MKETKDTNILIGIGIFLFIWTLSSCTTMRNAEKRHDRIVRNFPNVHMGDTITIRDTVTITLDGFKDSSNLIFVISNDTIRDTIRTNDSITIINTIWRNKDGSNTLKTDIEQPNRTITREVFINRPVIYVNRPLKWWQQKFVISAMVWLAYMLGFGAGYIYFVKLKNN